MTFLGFIGLCFGALVAYALGVEAVRAYEDRDRRRHIEVCERIKHDRVSVTTVENLRERERMKQKARALRDLRAHEARQVVELERLWNIPSRTPFHEEIP